MCLSIVDTASKICQDIKPVLLLDTCALLDIVRTPVRENSTLDFQPSSLRHRSGGTIEAGLVKMLAVCY